MINRESHAEVLGLDAEPMWSEMDVEALCMETEAARKKSVNRTMTASTKREAARKRNPKGKGKAVSDAEAMERVFQNSEERKNRPDPDADESNWNAERYTDRLAFDAKSYRQFWDDLYAPVCCRFEDHTNIPCMRLTYKPLPHYGFTSETLEVFSVKVAEISGGLQWPLDVFGMVALRDSLDRNRNVIFSRGRDSCQTLTDQDPYLLLTGPLRAAILCDPVTLEASLHVRGSTQSDDKELSLLSTSFWDGCKPRTSYFTSKSYTSRLSTLEFGLGLIVRSVEATIIVKVSSGS